MLVYYRTGNVKQLLSALRDLAKAGFLIYNNPSVWSKELSRHTCSYEYKIWVRLKGDDARLARTARLPEPLTILGTYTCISRFVLEILDLILLT